MGMWNGCTVLWALKGYGVGWAKVVWVVGGLSEAGMGYAYADGSRCEDWDRAGCVGYGTGRVGVVARVGLHAEKLRHATHGALRPPGATGPNPHTRLR